MSFNKIIIVGNLGRDPELRYTPQGTAVCNFSVATNEKKKDKGGEMQDVTTWFRVTLWNKQAETASKYLTKGSPIYVEGRLRVEEWNDRDGKTRYTLEVHATDMQFISTGRGDEFSGDSSAGYNDFEEPKSSATPAGSMNQAVPSDDDIPF
ncbi:MAG: single-stranded DNA-binding protein [Acidobacteria bacterium]|jgi:single-strand DNA-binding protein|nr:single-stranded DNA-binding protein [Acidobacteriota bacterium]